MGHGDVAGSRSEIATPGSRRIGVFGGTFDPPHLGHVSVARSVLEALSLDEVVLVPNGVPAWKLDRAVAPASDRWAMCWLATRGVPGLRVSRVEVDRPGVTITVDTIREIRLAAGADAELFLVAGADTVADMPMWEGIGEIARSMRIAAVTRPGHNMDAVRAAVAACPEPLDVAYIEVPSIELSSTAVRRAIREGEDVVPLVGPDVAAYVRDAGLYLSEGVACGTADGLRPHVTVGRDCVGAGAQAVVVRDGSVLMLRRLRMPGAGLWDLPGGKVELGEPLSAAIVRELRDETGLSGHVTRFLSTCDNIVPEDAMHFVVSAFVVEATGIPENREPQKHSEMAWFPLDALPTCMTCTARAALDALSE